MAYLSGDVAGIPFWRMALASAEEVGVRAKALAAGLPETGARVEVVNGFSTTGGGSAPTSRIPTSLLRVEPGPAAPRPWPQRLLAHDPHVVARIEDGGLVLDLRTVDALGRPGRPGRPRRALKGT